MDGWVTSEVVSNQNWARAMPHREVVDNQNWGKGHTSTVKL